MRHLFKFNLVAFVLFSITNVFAQWENIGTPGFSSGEAKWLSMAIDNNGTPYVAYSDAGNSGKATVMKFSGTTWIAVGNAGFSPDTARYPSLAINELGTPYLAYSDAGNSNRLTVVKYSGNAWVTVGNTTEMPDSVNNLSLAINYSGTPYVAFHRFIGGYGVFVMKFNGSAWENANENYPSYEHWGQFPTLVIDKNDSVFVAFANVSFNGEVVRVQHPYVQSMGEFTDEFSGLLSRVSMSVDSKGMPYIFYQEMERSANIVKKYNGSSWEDVGTTRFSNNPINQNALVLDYCDKPYITYTDGYNGNRATVKRFNGSAWETVGNAGFSSGPVNIPTMAFDRNGKLYVAYQDGGHSNKITVMGYNPSVELHSQAEVDAFSKTSVQGSLTINGQDIVDLSHLSNLTSVGTYLKILSCKNLTNLDGLNNLTSVCGLQIYHNTSLNNLDGLSNIDSVDGNLFIIQNDALSNLDGLSLLSFIGGDFKIIDNVSLDSYCGLYPLMSSGTINGAFEVSGNSVNPTKDDIINAGKCPVPDRTLNFDGTDDYVQIENSDIENFNQFEFYNGGYAVEARIQMASGARDFTGIVSKAQANNSTTWKGFQLLLYQNKLSAEFNDSTHFIGPQTGFIGTTDLNDGKWHHVALVAKMDPEYSINLYVDGALENSIIDTALALHSMFLNTEKVLIGTERTSALYFPGNIDEVRLWNVPRSESEIRDNMDNRGLSPDSPGLVAYYQFDQGDPGAENSAETALFNTTTNANNGTLYNFAMSGETSNWIEVKNPATAIHANGNEKLPSGFTLAQNYPNPFNPGTTISFALPKASDVTLAIYNMRGQLIQTLVSGRFSAGQHRAVWNGRDANGAQVASGVYLYRLKTGHGVQSKKMLLMK